MKARLLVACLIVGSACFAAGVFVGGQREAPAPGVSQARPSGTSTRAEGLLRDLHTLEREHAAQEQTIAQLRRRAVYAEVAERAAPTDVAPAAPTPETAEPTSLEGFPLDDLLATRRACGEEDVEKAALLDAELRRRMLEDPEVLATLLAEFRRTPEANLTALLGGFRHPETERIALAMAAPGASTEARLQALELLDRLDNLAPTNHAALLDLVANERDPQVLGAALYALPHGVFEPSLHQRTRGVLASSSTHEDAGVRARAVLVLGLRPLDAEDAGVVIARLTDAAPEVRTTAVSALRNYRGSDVAAVVRALRARMNDAGEDKAVREAAWTTLGGFPLDATTHSEWDAFGHTLDGQRQVQRSGLPE